MKIKLLLSTLVVLLSFTTTSYASFPVTANTVTTTTTTQITESEINTTLSSPAAAADRGTVAIILALVSVLLLPFGFHNWYLGRNKQALWQTLLVFPLGLLILPAIASWIWQVVDLVRILSKDPKFD